VAESFGHSLQHRQLGRAGVAEQPIDPEMGEDTVGGFTYGKHQIGSPAARARPIMLASSPRTRSSTISSNSTITGAFQLIEMIAPARSPPFRSLTMPTKYGPIPRPSKVETIT